MPTTVEALASEAIKLSQEERARLADLILASLPCEEDPLVDAAWDEEIRQRLSSVQAGTAVLHSSEDVHAAARKIYER